MSDDTPMFIITENKNRFVRFQWKIDISSIPYSGSLRDIGRTEQPNTSLDIDSDAFSIDPCDSVKWKFNAQLCCKFGTVRVGSDFYFFEIDYGIILKEDNLNGKNVKVMLCYNVIDDDSIMYTKNPVLYCSYPNSNTEFQEKHTLSPVYSNNSLIFFRNKIMIIEGHITLEDDCQQINEKCELANLRQLQQDWKEALQDERFLDVSLEVEGSTLKAHKIVLSSRSRVFRKMFETDMSESSKNTVNIEDVAKSTMEAFIVFLYTGKIEDHSLCSVTALYYAADKYGVTSLQDTCRNLLVSYLSVGTALCILNLSDRHNDNCLKDIAVNYIVVNFQKIFISKEWKTFVEANTYLASYLVNCISLKMLKM